MNYLDIVARARLGEGSTEEAAKIAIAAAARKRTALRLRPPLTEAESAPRPLLVVLLRSGAMVDEDDDRVNR